MNSPLPVSIHEDAPHLVVCAKGNLFANCHAFNLRSKVYWDNAALIVRAVNSHDALLAALRAARPYVEHSDCDNEALRVAHLAQIDASIAAAEGAGQ